MKLSVLVSIDRSPMENAFKLLENIVQKHDSKAFVAKRSKRYFSIVRKLNIIQMGRFQY